MFKGLEHLSHAERLRELSFKKKQLRGDFTSVCKYLKGGYQEGVASLFLVLLSHKMRCSGQELEHRNCHLNLRNNFFTVKVTEH